MYRVDIIDDHKACTVGLQNLLNATSNKYQVKKVWFNAPDFLLSLKTKNATEPDLVLIDYRMPFLQGFHLSYLLQRDYPHIKKIGFSSDAKPKWIEHFIATGCKAFIEKSGDQIELNAAIETVLKNEFYYNLYVNEKLVKDVLAKSAEFEFPYQLTDNEYILIHLCQTSLSRENIADILNLNVETLKKNLGKIYKMFNAKSHGELVSLAIEKGIIKYYRIAS
jgi:DNA-binding NarL/FixJ family response regulator